MFTVLVFLKLEHCGHQNQRDCIVWYTLTEDNAEKSRILFFVDKGKRRDSVCGDESSGHFHRDQKAPFVDGVGVPDVVVHCRVDVIEGSANDEETEHGPQESERWNVGKVFKEEFSAHVVSCCQNDRRKQKTEDGLWVNIFADGDAGEMLERKSEDYCDDKDDQRLMHQFDLEG